jgi:predicted DNA-binding protein (MmcQ/YjbR family)
VDEPALERLVGQWPGVSSDVKWGDDLVFSVAGKMFVVYCFRGTYAGRISFKVDDERFLELTDREGFMPAPYMARAHWVTVGHAAPLAPGELEGFIRSSYELVRAKLPKKQQRELAG